MKRWFACALAAALLAAGCSNDGDSARLVGEETTTSSTLPEGVAFADDDPPVTTTTAAPVVPLTLRIGVPDLVFEPPYACLLYTSPSPRDATLSRMPSSA